MMSTTNWLRMGCAVVWFAAGVEATPALAHGWSSPGDHRRDPPGAVEPTDPPTPFLTSGVIELGTEGQNVTIAIEGGSDQVFVTDILANAPDLVTLFLAVQPAGGGGCQGPGNVPTLLVSAEEQLSINLTSPILVDAGEQLCIFAVSESDNVTVGYSLIGYSVD